MTPRSARALGAVLCAGVVVLAGCSAGNITGEPEDIGTLIHVDTERSNCTLGSGGDSITFHVTLKNTGGDDRTVSVTPRLRSDSGEEVGSTLDGFELTVAGDSEAERDAIMERVPDHVTSCFVQIDSGDDIQVTADLAGDG